MKKLIPIIILCLLPWLADAKTCNVVVGQGVVTECSYPAEETATATSLSARVCRLASEWMGVAHSFTATSGYDIVRFSTSLYKTGSPNCNIKVYLYSDKTSGCPSSRSHCPDALLATSTTTVACSSITTEAANYDFDFAAYTLTNGVMYWSVIRPSSYVTCNSDHSVGLQLDTTGGSSEAYFWDDDPGEFVFYTNGVKITYTTRSCN